MSRSRAAASTGDGARALRRIAPLAVLALALALCPAALGAPRRAAGRQGPPPTPATVVSVQRLFHVLGYPLGGEGNGVLGVRTRGALSYFQRKYGLAVTGYPDARTLAKMRAVAASLTAAPSSRAQPRDLLGRSFGGVPITGVGFACALGLSLLALAARGREARLGRNGASR